MKTVQIPVYTFAELSPKAKERVISAYQADCGYVWHDEAIASLEALAKHFGGKLADYAVNWFESSYSYAQFAMPEETTRDEIKVLLGQLCKDCPLTGHCADIEAIAGFCEAFDDGETDLDTLMQAAFHSWLKAGQADCADFYSDTYFAEHCEANEYEFFANGTPYNDGANQ